MKNEGLMKEDQTKLKTFEPKKTQTEPELVYRPICLICCDNRASQAKINQ